MIDHERGAAQVLRRRAVELGWQERVLLEPPSIEEVTAIRPGAVVIDLELLGDRRWDYLEELARTLRDTVVVVTTTPSTVADRVRGLRLGADDWVTKPAHPEEVIARVQAALRRRRGTNRRSVDPVTAGELQIRPDQFQAFVGEQPVGLTRREYELLELLCRSEGKVLEREEIYSRVWGYSMVRGDRSVDVFVGRIRAKLSVASPGWSYIHTRVGVGYRFVPEQV